MTLRLVGCNFFHLFVTLHPIRRSNCPHQFSRFFTLYNLWSNFLFRLFTIQDSRQIPIQTNAYQHFLTANVCLNLTSLKVEGKYSQRKA